MQLNIKPFFADSCIRSAAYGRLKPHANCVFNRRRLPESRRPPAPVGAQLPSRPASAAAIVLRNEFCLLRMQQAPKPADFPLGRHLQQNKLNAI